MAAVGLVTLAGATALYREKSPGLRTLVSRPISSEAKGDSQHVLGSPNAAVTLEEFGDFQCPPCGMLSEPINQLEKDYHTRLRIIFRHFPLANHEHAHEAALAAEAAAAQGRFWEMHDLLYREQGAWSKASDARALFDSYARMLGLNIERFKKDIASASTKARVGMDMKEATSLGVRNTPTIFLNNRALPPNELNPANLRTAVDRAIKQKHQSP